MDFSRNKNYFEDIAKKIDRLEHPELYQEEQVIVNPDTYGTADGNNTLVPVALAEPSEEDLSIPNIQEINDNLPQIESDRIDGVISLYKELNRTYGLKFDAEKITNIGTTFKAIISPEAKEVFEVYLREYLDRLRLACINQLGNTVYSLIQKLTSEETLRSLTISERVALLDRLFEYMDRVNNMVSYIKPGDTNSELRELAERIENNSDNPSSSNKKSSRNRELQNYVLKLLSNKK